MGAALKWGIILVVAVTALNAIWIGAAWHTTPTGAMGFVGVAILVNIVAVILALKETAGENGYGRQLLAGLVVGIVGAIGIFLTSWMMLSFVFAEAIPDQIAGFTAAYQSWPIPDEQKAELVVALDGVTAVTSAMQGAVGTLFTSFIVGAIAGAFLRRK
ncbi:MAG: DUF4199 family protein [Acidobacteriota bacterium]|jgi:hypothetical protein